MLCIVVPWGEFAMDCVISNAYFHQWASLATVGAVTMMLSLLAGTDAGHYEHCNRYKKCAGM